MPASMYEATVILIPKPEKDRKECASYRPISLLNIDYKVLAKVLAKRLNGVILSIVSEDQTGFMLGKSTTNNIRRTQLMVQLKDYFPESSALASLDTAKAFDSIEWEFLQAVLEKSGFGEGFRKWVRILYKQPCSNLLINGILSPTVKLQRGTRQGCPLSPQLFSLAIEVLANRFRQSKIYKGFRVGDRTEHIGLFADDIILYMEDAYSSLGEAMKIIET